MKLLLHACCGPCSLEPVRVLREEGVEPAILFANSNIHPREEYDHRLATLREWAAAEGVSVAEGRYDVRDWDMSAGAIGSAALAKALAGLAAEAAEAAEAAVPDEAAAPTGAAAPTAADVDGAGTADQAAVRTALDPRLQAALAVDPDARAARCRACYRLRFEETARYAAEHGFDAIGTTLSVSPYQYTGVIEEELDRAAARHGLDSVFRDFRPYYDEATRRSREAGMYRQNFCGCRFSDEEAQAERQLRKALRAAERAAHAAEHAAERQAQEARRAEKRAERQAYQDKQQRKHAILKAMRNQMKDQVKEENREDERL